MPELPEVSTRTPDQMPIPKQSARNQNVMQFWEPPKPAQFDLWLLLQSFLCYKHRKSQHFRFRISNVWMSFFRLVWDDIFLSWSFLKNSLNPLTECWHRKINTYFDYLWIAYIANLKKANRCEVLFRNGVIQQKSKTGIDLKNHLVWSTFFQAHYQIIFSVKLVIFLVSFDT